MINDTYFAARDPDETAANLLQRYNHWNTLMTSNGYLDKLVRVWSAYSGAYYADASSGHQITFSGSNGELANLPVNHLHNIGQHMLVMTTSSRPTMEARATNTDHKSLTQSYLANGLLDYYMREKRLETYLKRAVEYAIVLGSGFIKMSWNETSGEKYEMNEELNIPIYEGDVEFTNLSPFDVLMDTTKEDSSSHDWYVCRTWKNKYDVAAKYPELADKILAAPSKAMLMKYRISLDINDNTDDIAIYEFFHKRTESLPDGRYLMFVDNNTVLSDSPLPYRKLPVFRISPGDFLGTPYGYTSLFDLLPIQEGINSLYSTILTNQNAFGVQSVLVPRGCDISPTEISSGLNIIEYNAQAGKPEAMQLTETPAEIFNFVNMLKEEMETISGISSVARGNPEASLKSGAALALVQSMSIQFMSGLQGSYVQLIEDVGTSLIAMLRDFASVPRVAAIVGKDNRAYMQEFKGDDLSTVNRVIVDVGNPLSRSVAGRVQIAEQLLQMGSIKNPHQYFTVLNTGNLGVVTEGEQKELLLIKSENESMLSGESVPVIQFDDHTTHIMEHKSVLADPSLRANPQLVANVLSHIQEHIISLRQSDPFVAQIMQQPAPPPQQQPPQGPPGAPPDGPMPPGPQNSPTPPDDTGPEGQGLKPPSETVGPALDQAAPGTSLPNLPSLPKPPGEFSNLPTNPANNIGAS